MFRNPFRSRKASFVMKLGEAVTMAVPMGTTIPKRDMEPCVRVQVCVCVRGFVCVCGACVAWSSGQRLCVLSIVTQLSWTQKKLPRRLHSKAGWVSVKSYVLLGGNIWNNSIVVSSTHQVGGVVQESDSERWVRGHKKPKFKADHERRQREPH